MHSSVSTDAQLLEYNLLSDILLSSTNINVDTFACNDEQCCNADHHSDIDSLFNSGIQICGANERNHHRTVPGWDKHVAELHATVRSCYVRWRNCGKPHHGLEYDDMNSSKVYKITIVVACTCITVTTIFAHHPISMWTPYFVYHLSRVSNATNHQTFKTIITMVVQHFYVIRMVDRWQSTSYVVTRYSRTTRLSWGQAIHNHISCVIYPLYWM